MPVGKLLDLMDSEKDVILEKVPQRSGRNNLSFVTLHARCHYPPFRWRIPFGWFNFPIVPLTLSYFAPGNNGFKLLFFCREVTKNAGLDSSRIQ